MQAQPSLPGIDVEPIPTDRLFFAVFPETDVALSIEQFAWSLRENHGLNGNVLATDRFHISLHHIGDFVGLPPDTLAMAGKAADATAAVTAPFEIVFDRAMSFAGQPGNHPFVLCGSDCNPTLAAFHQTLGGAMARAGFKLKTSSHYTPHMTLLYGDRCIAEQIIEPVTLSVREFVLVRSLIRRQQYVPLAWWPLSS